MGASQRAQSALARDSPRVTESTESTATTDPAAVTIKVGANGPLEVVGPVTILADDGSVLREGARVYLCRCGHSAKKPFCDGSHNRQGFSDSGLGVVAES